MPDFIGLEFTIKKCLEIEDVQLAHGTKKKPYVDTENEFLIGILNQVVKAVSFDVTQDTMYEKVYNAYAAGMGIDYSLLRIPETKYAQVYDILSSNRFMDIQLPPPLVIVVIGVPPKG